MYLKCTELTMSAKLQAYASVFEVRTKCAYI